MVDNDNQIFIYDPISHIRRVVTLPELIRDYPSFHDFRVYESASGNNPKVSKWLQDRGLQPKPPRGQIAWR
jgi:hypothetical protein